MLRGDGATIYYLWCNVSSCELEIEIWSRPQCVDRDATDYQLVEVLLLFLSRRLHFRSIDNMSTENVLHVLWLIMSIREQVQCGAREMTVATLLHWYTYFA